MRLALAALFLLLLLPLAAADHNPHWRGVANYDFNSNKAVDFFFVDESAANPECDPTYVGNQGVGWCPIYHNNTVSVDLAYEASLDADGLPVPRAALWYGYDQDNYFWDIMVFGGWDDYEIVYNLEVLDPDTGLYSLIASEELQFVQDTGLVDAQYKFDPIFWAPGEYRASADIYSTDTGQVLQAAASPLTIHVTSGSFYGQQIAGVSDAFGIPSATSGWFLGAVLVALVAGGFFFLAGPAGAVFGGLLAAGAGSAIGLFPVWLTIFLAAGSVFVVFVSIKSRGAG